MRPGEGQCDDLLAAETGIPLPTAQKLVSRLSLAGLLESTRGTGGGVRLARPPAAISLADIVEAVEGPIAMTTCVETGRHDCALEGCCQVRPHMGVVNGAVRGALAGVSPVQPRHGGAGMSAEDINVRNQKRRTRSTAPRPTNGAGRATSSRSSRPRG